MIFVLLTMLVCLLLSAAIALYVAYPARGRSLPVAGRSGSAVRGRSARGQDAGGPQVGSAVAEGGR